MSCSGSSDLHEVNLNKKKKKKKAIFTVNSNIYTDFRTAWASSDLAEPKCHKNKH